MVPAALTPATAVTLPVVTAWDTVKGVAPLKLEVVPMETALPLGEVEVSTRHTTLVVWLAQVGVIALPPT